MTKDYHKDSIYQLGYSQGYLMGQKELKKMSKVYEYSRKELKCQWETIVPEDLLDDLLALSDKPLSDKGGVASFRAVRKKYLNPTDTPPVRPKKKK
jgi:hypothetical protein